jgi:superfamily II DNA or RNA helicase
MLASKQLIQKPCGIDADPGGVNAKLFPFQRDFVRWALRKGRSAIFADTGLGKTLMQIEWARMVGGRVLIVSPLAVAEQTVAEGEKIGVRVHYARRGEDAGPGVTITNYEMAEHFRDIEWNGLKVSTVEGHERC